MTTLLLASLFSNNVTAPQNEVGQPLLTKTQKGAGSLDIAAILFITAFAIAIIVNGHYGLNLPGLNISVDIGVYSCIAMGGAVVVDLIVISVCFYLRATKVNQNALKQKPKDLKEEQCHLATKETQIKNEANNQELDGLKKEIKRLEEIKTNLESFIEEEKGRLNEATSLKLKEEESLKKLNNELKVLQEAINREKQVLEDYKKHKEKAPPASQPSPSQSPASQPSLSKPPVPPSPPPPPKNDSPKNEKQADPESLLREIKRMRHLLDEKKTLGTPPPLPKKASDAIESILKDGEKRKAFIPILNDGIAYFTLKEQGQSLAQSVTHLQLTLGSLDEELRAYFFSCRKYIYEGIPEDEAERTDDQKGILKGRAGLCVYMLNEKVVKRMEGLKPQSSKKNSFTSKAEAEDLEEILRTAMRNIRKDYEMLADSDTEGEW